MPLRWTCKVQMSNAPTNSTRVSPWQLRAFFWLRRKGYKFDNLKRRCATRIFKLLFKGAYRNITYFGIEDFDAEVKTAWNKIPRADVRLTIVVVTYKQPVQLRGLLASLQCQTLQNFEVLVIHDGPDAQTRQVVEQVMAESDRFSYLETDTRYNDYGHSLRDLGVSMASREFLLITNGDNYYMPRFTEFVFEAVTTYSLDVATWDIVHSYCHPGKTSMRSYNPFRVYPVRWMVDIASILVKTELAKIVGFADKSYDGDASYVEDVLSIRDRSIRLGKIEKTLTVHN